MRPSRCGATTAQAAGCGGVAALVTDEPADRASLADGRVIAANPSFEAATGFSGTEVVGCCVGDLLLDHGTALVQLPSDVDGWGGVPLGRLWWRAAQRRGVAAEVRVLALRHATPPRPRLLWLLCAPS